ncbi:MAG: T9SS type A sorting domain-containing protein [Patescibacteria group bacterium]|nr:T9SS type A sorting domain-containing protein [Patescibacteria group bacterium]
MTDYGSQYHCVELVNRVHKHSDWSGDGDEYYGSARTKGLVAYENSGTQELPKHGDILCYSGGGHGHVALVDWVNKIDDSGLYEVGNVEQNWSVTGRFTHTLQRGQDGKLTMSSRGSYAVQGWLRNPAYRPGDYASLFNDEYNSNGGDRKYGRLQWDIHFYHPEGERPVYGDNHVPTNCLCKNFGGGEFGNCGILLDVYGGATHAYTVRNDFWENSRSDYNQKGWAQRGGPTSPEGMPINDERYVPPERRGYYQNTYGIANVSSVQEYVRGERLWDGYNPYLRPYPPGSCAPGWFADGWRNDNNISYRFVDCFNRNGGSQWLGHAIQYDWHPAHVHQWNGYDVQFFDHAAFGLVMVMYDPNNGDGNACATNEAYCVRTGFLDYYLSHGGPAEFGCPTRDEYVIDGLGAIDFYHRGRDVTYRFIWRNNRVDEIQELPPCGEEGEGGGYGGPEECSSDDPNSFIGNGQFDGQSCWTVEHPNLPYVVTNFNGLFEGHINGPHEWYEVKLSQDWVYLTANSDLEVVFTGVTNDPGTVVVSLEDSRGNHVLWEEVPLTSTERRLTLPFRSNVTDPNGRLTFYLGWVDRSVWLKDVVVRYAETPPPQPVCSGDDSGSFIGNGQFDGQSCWTVEHPNLPYVVTNFNGLFEGHINGPHEWYEVKLSQDWVYLTANSDLEVVFTGVTNDPGTVVVSLEDSRGNHVLWEEVPLTSTERRLTLPFRSNVTDPNGRLTFYLGWVDRSVWLKDVSVRWKQTLPVPIACERDEGSFLGNGDFSTPGACWLARYPQLRWADFRMENNNGWLLVNGGTNWYDYELKQGGFTLTRSEAYKLNIVLSADTPCRVTVAVGNRRTGKFHLWKDFNLGRLIDHQIGELFTVTTPNEADTLYIFAGKSPNSVWAKNAWLGRQSLAASIVGTGLMLSPNPANSSAPVTVSFTLEKESPVRVDVFDITGRKVKSLLDEPLAQGPHAIIWNGRNSDGSVVPSGIYFVKIRADNYPAEKRLIIVH